MPSGPACEPRRTEADGAADRPLVGIRVLDLGTFTIVQDDDLGSVRRAPAPFVGPRWPGRR